MEHKEVTGDSQHSFTEGTSCACLWGTHRAAKLGKGDWYLPGLVQGIGHCPTDTLVPRQEGFDRGALGGEGMAAAHTQSWG